MLSTEGGKVMIVKSLIILILAVSLIGLLSDCRRTSRCFSQIEVKTMKVTLWSYLPLTKTVGVRMTAKNGDRLVASVDKDGHLEYGDLIKIEIASGKIKIFWYAVYSNF